MRQSNTNWWGTVKRIFIYIGKKWKIWFAFIYQHKFMTNFSAFYLQKKCIVFLLHSHTFFIIKSQYNNDLILVVTWKKKKTTWRCIFKCNNKTMHKKWFYYWFYFCPNTTKLKCSSKAFNNASTVIERLLV